jgi:hypothetical protein
MRACLWTLCEVAVPSRHFVWIFFLCFLSLPAFAQNPTQRQPSLPSRGDVNTPMTDEDDARNRIADEMAKKAAKERVAALKSDTDKLLKLSVELKAYVDKSDENVLSLDVIKKADEIEKLAKSVKDKMRGPN